MIGDQKQVRGTNRCVTTSMKQGGAELCQAQNELGFALLCLASLSQTHTKTKKLFYLLSNNSLCCKHGSFVQFDLN